ncbi:12864_t:CDS:2 [Rhizophagus irregularis]|nr:12864_t:CDS:2 [Rhizophagus irregularis]
MNKDQEYYEDRLICNRANILYYYKYGEALEKKRSKKVIRSSGVDWEHHQKLIKCVERYAEARQKVLSIPGISVLEDIQYAMALIHEEYKANTWPDKFKNKYNLSLAESPLKEALVAARILEEYSDLTTVLHRDLNYDWHWAVNETGEMLDKTIGYDSSYDDHLEESEVKRSESKKSSTEATAYNNWV